jgi:hypothetical protein
MKIILLVFSLSAITVGSYSTWTSNTPPNVEVSVPAQRSISAARVPTDSSVDRAPVISVERAVPANCAGEWTRAVAVINAPAHGNTLVIRNAASVQDAVRRANKCRNDVGTVSFFDEGSRLACAPYVVCDTQ